MADIPERMQREGAWVAVEPGQSFDGTVQQLQISGYETYGKPEDNIVWFAPSTDQLPDLLAKGPWVQTSDGATILKAALDKVWEPPIPESIPNLQNLNVSSELRHTLLNDPPLAVLRRWRNEVMSKRSSDLVRMLDVVLLPTLFKRWPGAAIGFVGPTLRAQILFGNVRLHAVREIVSIDQMRYALKDRGFPVLRSLHTSLGVTASLYLAAISTMTYPHNRIWIIPRYPGDFIIVLPENVPTEPSALDLIREPLDSSFQASAEHMLLQGPVDMVNISAILTYIDEALGNINALLSEAFSLVSLRTKQGRADFVAILKRSLLLDKIAQSVLEISTSSASYARVSESFVLLDLFSSLAMDRLAKRINALPSPKGERARLLNRREPLLGDTLMSQSALASMVVPGLSKWQNVACRKLGATARRRLEALHQGSQASIFAGTSEDGTVQIRFRELDEETGERGQWRTRLISQNELAGQLVRQLRNTHHGYDLRDEFFEGLLAVSDGAIGDHLPAYLEHIWMSMLGEPGRWINGGLADFVVLPET